MSNSSNSASGGIGLFGGALGVLFVGLKLGGVIDWSWIWVLAPFWIGLAVVLIIVVIVGIVAIIYSLI